MSEVLDIQDLDDHPDETCIIVIIPRNEIGAFPSDCNSGGSDMEYEWEASHLPSSLLNACAKLIQTDYDNSNIIGYDAAECAKQSCSDSIDIFLLMY